MLVVKVWGLPKKTEEELRHVHDCIVKAAGLAELSPVKTERDLMVWFPPDLMRYGLGEDILVEISGCGSAGRIVYSLTRRIGQALQVLFPKALVECHYVSTNNLWSSPEEQASGIPM